MQSDHYLWRKGYPYESSSHIPMLVREGGGMSGVGSNVGGLGEEGSRGLGDGDSIPPTSP